MENVRTGLVLEGGVRGIFTAGVLDVFLENGVTFDGLIGVSAGAIHGCSYLSGQKGRSIRYYRRYVADPRFMSFRSWLTTGDYIGAEFCYHTLPDELDVYDHDAFLRNPTAFYAVCTNVETGLPEYIRMRDMRGQIEYLRASASLPYFSRVVALGGRKYLDGGCADSIPLDAARDLGYGRNVVVLTRDAAYRKSPELTALAKVVYRRYPAFVRTLEKRAEMYNTQLAQVAELEKAGDIFVIRPEAPLPIRRLESSPDKVQIAYDLGRAAALKALNDLKAWLARA